jgi:hypothetical protein
VVGEAFRAGKNPTFSPDALLSEALHVCFASFSCGIHKTWDDNSVNPSSASFKSIMISTTYAFVFSSDAQKPELMSQTSLD